MRSIRVILTTDQCSALKAQALRAGDSVSAIVRQAIDAHLARLKPEGRLQTLRQARGLWKGRTAEQLAALRPLVSGPDSP